MEPERNANAELDRRTLLKQTAHAVTSAVAAAAVGAPAYAAEPTPELAALDALTLAKTIRSKRASCVEVMEAHLKQIDRLNGAANAIVALQPRETLLREAKERDEQLAKSEAVGPLHGFPHAVKDLVPVKGIRFTQGFPAFRDRVATADSLLVERLRKEGAVIIGKTNTPEFGMGSHTVNRVYGATHNPYNPARTAGGSSGGAAVALALRMMPVADGSDYGGSLRNPAGWNNVCGFRTSIGRVPADGADVWLPSMSVSGPMARNVADLAMLLSVLAGYDARSPLSMESDGSAFAGSLAANVKGKRIGWLGTMGGAIPYEQGVLDVCRAALKRFETLGCVVEDVTPAYDVERAWQAFVRLRSWQYSAGLATIAKNPEQRAMLNDQAQFELTTSEKLSATDITEASQLRTAWGRAVHALFEHYDYLISPTAQLFPFDITARWPTEIAGVSMRTYHEWMKGVCLITAAGTPSLAVPAGFGAEGLPIGLQIIAPVHHEMACLQLGAAYEAVEPLWRTRPPPGVRA